MTDSLDAILIGVSPAMERLRRDIARIAPTGISVMIQGETGTGKELVSLAIHRLSGLRGAFVPVNVAAIPDTLFESQVFGHVRGAFTGAIVDQRGFVEEAKSGTLFLDEISEAPLAGQAKLLRVLECGQVRPVGARADRSTSFRLVAAANSSLHSEVAAKRFRADLFYRICGDVVSIPPLRARVADVEPLTKHFASSLCARIGRTATFTAGAMRALMDYEWPGNVRQLRTVVERAVVGADTDVVGAGDVMDVLDRLTPRPADVGRLSELGAELLTHLQRFSWDTTRVAAELGISRKTVYARIQKYDLRIPGKYTRRVDASSCLPSRAVLPDGGIEVAISPISELRGQHRDVA
jgi:DNA-binding NtrC family response regulator